MLLVRVKGRSITYILGRQVSSSGKYDIWEFHQSASSYVLLPGYTPYRHAAIIPAEPKEGQTVIIAICKPGAPDDQ
jgi:hypothetical protein